jgi:uncharacterized repeat protein (TIGR03803 family)
MTNKLPCWNLRVHLCRATTALAASVVFVLAVVAMPSAGAQTFSVLYNFPAGAFGGGPRARLVQDAAGNLYGTTAGGGKKGTGTAFKLIP